MLKNSTKKVNSRILRIKNAKFGGYCFYMNTSILGGFQNCISVPLKISQNSPENTCARFSVLIKLQANAQYLSCFLNF